MKYSTTQEFGGQCATVGRTVLIAAKQHDSDGVCLRAGIIVAIGGTSDRPYILDLAHPEHRPIAAEWGFVKTSIPADLEALPMWSWTWPPRV